MTWIRLDDNFPDHPKVIGLSDKAFRVHLQGLCYGGQYLTDGFIPMFVAAKFADNNMSVLAELTNAKLWVEKMPNNGFQIHDFLVFQSSKESIETRKEQLRHAQSRFRSKKKDNSNQEVITDKSISNQDVINPHTHTHTPTHTPEVLVQEQTSAYKLTELFVESLKSNNLAKNAKITNDWVAVIDRMLRLDKREDWQIEKAIAWAHGDDFWASNILSPQKLRKHYDRLRLDAQKKTSQPKGLAVLLEMKNQEIHREELE